MGNDKNKSKRPPPIITKVKPRTDCPYIGDEESITLDIIRQRMKPEEFEAFLKERQRILAEGP